MEVPKEAQEKIARLQLLEQNLQQFLMQRQQFQTQLFEVENALKELDAAQTVYKIVGNIMVSSNKDVMKKDLEQRKELITVRLSSIEKQESQLKDKAKKLQEEVLIMMKKE